MGTKGDEDERGGRWWASTLWVAVAGPGGLVLSGTVVRGNVATADGAGLYLGGNTATITNTTFSANSAYNHGGGVAVSTGAITLTYASVVSNTADGDSTATCDIGAYEYQGAGGFYRSEQYRVLSAADSAPSLLPPAAQAARPRASVILTGTAISYTYDALYRLTRADYTNGQYFAYTYDAVGNRTSEVACAGTPCAPIITTYSYDDANRLIAVDGQPYTWDDNGNLLADGVLTYTYDAANRLIGTTNGVTTTTYSYNGRGDRVNQVVNGVVTTYTLDLAAGLTQVLADGRFTYLYGNGRVAQATVTQTEYFLGDALGSVRHLVDGAGQVTLARSYEPYGDVLTSAGSGVTSYSFTGEWRDGSGLIYLRARYYASGVGRFVTRDTWVGDYYSPSSLNSWAYGGSNPVLYTDPSGHCVFAVVDTLICIEVADLVVVGAIAVAYIIFDTLGRHGYEVAAALEQACGPLASLFKAPSQTQTTTRPTTWQDILSLPEASGQSQQDPVLRPDPQPVPVPLPLPNPSSTPRPPSTRRLYHGTQLSFAESIQMGIDMSKQLRLTDFGQGFYTTANYEDAKRLAIRRNDRGGNNPVVIQFDVPVDALNSLSHKIFTSADDEWKAFVYYHRSTPGVNHSYDWVEGPVASTYSSAGNVTAFAYPNYHQLSIHTSAAIQLFQASITAIIPVSP